MLFKKFIGKKFASNEFRRLVMKKKIVLLLNFVIILSLVFFSSCEKQEKVEEDKIIKIGAILPLTGDAATYGERLREGFEISKYAFEKANSEPILKIFFEDSRIDPKEAVNAFYKLIQGGDIKFIVGPYSSSEVLAIAPIAEKRKILVISPGASSPMISKAGDYIFRVVASDIYDAKVIAHFIEKELKASKASIVYINNDYGVGIEKTFSKEFISLGGKVIDSISFEQNTTDFKTFLSKLDNNKPEIVVLIGFKEMGFFLKQMGEMGLNFRVISTGLFENPDIINIAGEFAENTYYTIPYFNLTGDEEVLNKFKLLFEEMFPGKKPSIEHALAYDCLNVLLFAIKNTDGRVDSVKNKIYTIKNFPGVAGSITFDQIGDVIKPYGIKIYKDKEFEWLIPVFEIK